MNKTAIVTGANSGFGKLITLRLAQQGYTVIAGVRQETNAKKLAEEVKNAALSESIHIEALDVTDTQSIQAFQKRLNAYAPIHLLVNNAGTAYAGFAEEVPVDQYREQFEVNVFGVMEMTQAVLPLMTSGAKIFNMSSISGLMGMPALSPYVSSKFALEGYTESLRIELAAFGIQAALIEPGSFQTNIWNTSMNEQMTPPSAGSKYTTIYQNMMSYIETQKNNYGDPGEVAELVVSLAEKKRLKKLRYLVGKGVRLSFIAKQLLPWNVWENIILRTLSSKK
ncbi:MULTISPECIES: oxidoreductase [Bacillus]|uniref:NAD(P)-dependent dehydrogenase (Short-subunit alcohol dehydrogenase family) n=1 Tax=Bacillus aerius TaxID=293388 RepID=A0ABR6AYY4_9BACI|nr:MULTISPECIES: oxidoreductase [Bacillus]KML04549.1 short-chain dehydrogenase [Bacillus stratosphericus]MBW3702419.1 short-chain dehydrogenase [Bacillus aerophilus]MDH8708854.1 NAD(P)-dependent dehydrogenase (short-subunit alcohol dehydrogenase family) [Micromonospora sp. 1209]AKU30101.1 short-chain dehydrogenase [Bacillus altitudinis]APP15795.1 short-chain dehydrogenase [Bacillus altitudinis]